MSFMSTLRGGASLLAFVAFAGPLAANPFTEVAQNDAPVVRAAATQPGSAIYAGSKITLSGEKLVPGQNITLMRGTTVLNPDAPIVVGPEGKFSFELTLPEAAMTGQQPVVVIAENPSAAVVAKVKISPLLAVEGADHFEIASAPVADGLYQVAHSAKRKAIYVTSAVGRPPVKVAALSMLDAESLTLLAQVTPDLAPAARAEQEGGRFAPYGVAVDDSNDTVWVTNTRQNTIAVYNAADLSLIRQFEEGSVNHPRDIVVDPVRNRIYVSATRTNRIEVFDAKTYEKLPPIEIATKKRGAEWSAMALDIDPQGGTLVNVSMSSNEAAVVDLNSGDVRVFDLPGALAASGVAWDAQENLLFVVSQQSDQLLILDGKTGALRHDVPVGAQPLNVTFDPVSRQAFVANRGAGTITVVTADGKVTANLDAGSRTNQLRADGSGTVWAVNKSLGADDDRGNLIWRLRLAAK